MNDDVYEMQIGDLYVHREEVYCNVLILNVNDINLYEFMTIDNFVYASNGGFRRDQWRLIR